MNTSDFDYQTVWVFSTQHFEVALATAPISGGPADEFCSDLDVADIRSGKCAWFDAAVSVRSLRGEELGQSQLCGCVAYSIDEFRADRQFRELARQAIAEAREVIAATLPIYQAIRCPA
jgi:hypothetical protein